MADNSSVLFAVIMVAIGGLIWAIRLEGRINVADVRYELLNQDILEIKRDVKSLLVRQYKSREADNS